MGGLDRVGVFPVVMSAAGDLTVLDVQVAAWSTAAQVDLVAVERFAVRVPAADLRDQLRELASATSAPHRLSLDLRPCRCLPTSLGRLAWQWCRAAFDRDAS